MKMKENTLQIRFGIVKKKQKTSYTSTRDNNNHYNTSISTRVSSRPTSVNDPVDQSEFLRLGSRHISIPGNCICYCMLLSTSKLAEHIDKNQMNVLEFLNFFDHPM